MQLGVGLPACQKHSPRVAGAGELGRLVKLLGHLADWGILGLLAHLLGLIGAPTATLVTYRFIQLYLLFKGSYF